MTHFTGDRKVFSVLAARWTCVTFQMLLLEILVANRVCCLVLTVQRRLCKVTLDKSYILYCLLVLLAFSTNMRLLATKGKTIPADI